MPTVLLPLLAFLPAFAPPLRLQEPADRAPGAEDASSEERALFDRFDVLSRGGRTEEAKALLRGLLDRRARDPAETHVALLERAAEAFQGAGAAGEAADLLSEALQACREGALEEPYRRLQPRFVERAHRLGWDYKVIEAMQEPPGEGSGDRRAGLDLTLPRLLAASYLACDMNDEALAAFEGLLAVVSSGNDPAAEASAASGLAAALLSVGRYGEAWLRLDEASRRAEGVPAARGDASRARGRILLLAGMPERARDALLAAETSHLEAGDREGAALDCVLAAEASRRSSRAGDAEEAARRALELSSSAADPRIRDAGSLAYARSLLLSGATSEAAAVLDSVEKEARAGRRTAAIGAALLLRSDLEFSRGRIGEADRHAAAAQGVFRDGGLSFRSIFALSAALPLRARAGQRGPALESFSALVASLLRMRLPLCPEDFRIEIGDRIREALPLVPGIFAPPAPTGSAARDFYEPLLASDHLRSFRDALDLRRWQRPPADRPGLPASTLKSAEEGAERLRRELSSALAAGPAGEAGVAELRHRVALAEEEVRQILGRDRSLARFLGQFRRVSAAEGDRAREQTLGERGAYLGYFLGEAGSFLAVATREKQQILPLPPRKEVAAVARALLGRLSGREAWDEGAAAAARALSTLLLAPARGWIAGKRELWISPDGILHAVPFDALPVPGDEGPADGPEEPFGARHSVAYVPSFHFLLPDLGEPPEGPRETTDLFVVAGPGFGASAGKVAGIEHALGAGLVPGEAIPEGAAECREFAVRGARAFCPPADAARLEGCLRGDGALDLSRVHARGGSRATEDALWGDRTRYRAVLYSLPFAPGTHARWLAGFSCAPDPAFGRSAEGFLTSFEVRNALYRAELVVLPTTRVSADGESSLPLFARSFLAAGARRLLVRLFPGTDDAAFLENLFAALAGSPDRPLAALAAARQAARARSADPRAWAGFALYGDPR
ncbi:MAG TPA: CHAT domain-containing protein [Planctomycetota bacterium]|jgi:tetratricopeptide (TPR) repeat protein|nr:CHAT domain-containing protein [Planctomycetota bacterium]